jgi:hypothetical protein
MHKKLAADLTSLAHSILQMKNKDDVFALKNKAHEVYEKLSVLAYVEEYINTTPNPEHTKEELIEQLETIQTEKTVEAPIDTSKEEKKEKAEEVVIHSLEEDVEEAKAEPAEEKTTSEEISYAAQKIEIELSVETDEEKKTEESEIELKDDVVKEIEEKALDIIEDVSNHIEEEVKEAVEFLNEDLFTSESKGDKKATSLDDELKDTIAVDVVADLFENATKKSLNDKLQGDIQIGLNDRIAFVKNLFNGSQEDFNRVVSQLNTFKTEKEAKKFINKMVKPDYDWSEKEEYEERFMAIVERKFA